MALAAEHTSRIKLATGLLIPTNRIAPVAANGFASLNALAPARVIFGVGTGFTGRNTMGLPPQRLAAMRDYVEVVRTMLHGGTATLAVENTTRQVRFLNPENGMLNVTDPVPVHVSAFGPKSMELAARIGDGWVTFMGPVERAAQQAAQFAEACAAAGREAGSVYRTVFSLGCVLGAGEAADSPRALAQAGPGTAVGWHGLVERLQSDGRPLPPEMAAVYERYQPSDARYLELHRGHLLFVREDERQFVSADAIRAGTLTGTPEELRDRIRTVQSAGYDQVTVQLVYGHEDAVEDWAKVFELV
jgi:5,10-methylenetetrahydromethanopterin reductase